MMRGGVHHPERLSMASLTWRRGYPDCGLEMSWAACSLQEAHPRIVLQDDLAAIVADLCINITMELTKRAMFMTHGLPKR